MQGKLLRKKKKNESGQLTVEFIFAFAFALGLFMLFFALTFTFSMIEITQYVAFATARTQAGSNLDKLKQKEAATEKFEQLTGKTSKIGNLYKNGWYVIGKPILRQGGADGENFSRELSRPDPQAFSKVFTGVSIPFEAKILNMKIPFIGEEDHPFKTNINAIIIREVSQKECYEYFSERRDAVGRQKASQNFYDSQKYFQMEDNGC